MMTLHKPWFTYMVSCNDGTLYTGVTTDPARRLSEHNSLRSGARYTRSRQPVQLVFVEPQLSRSAACRREYELKQMPVVRKKLLIDRHSARENYPHDS